MDDPSPAVLTEEICISIFGYRRVEGRPHCFSGLSYSQILCGILWITRFKFGGLCMCSMTRLCRDCVAKASCSFRAPPFLSLIKFPAQHVSYLLGIEWIICSKSQPEGGASDVTLQSPNDQWFVGNTLACNVRCACIEHWPSPAGSYCNPAPRRLGQ